MELNKEQLNRFALYDAQIRGIDSEMKLLQQSANTLQAERGEAAGARAALYKEIGLDPALHVVISNKKTTNQNGVQMPFGKVYVIASGEEYVAPSTEPEPEPEQIEQIGTG